MPRLRLPSGARRSSRSRAPPRSRPGAYSPTISPSKMTRIRSASESTSSSSSETSRTARPCVALGDQAPVDVLDRADVEAARRLCGDQDLRVARHLAGDDDLLLVAARERAAGSLRAPAANVEVLDQLCRALEQPLRIEPARLRGRRVAVVVQRDVLRDRELEHEAAALAVFAGCARRRRRAFPARSHCAARPSRRPRPVPGTAAAGPVSASISSVWPFPSTPAIARISLARTWNETPRTFSRPRSSKTWRSSTSRSASPGAAAALSTRSSTSRPTIILARLSSVAPSAGRCRPSCRAGAR